VPLVVSAAAVPGEWALLNDASCFMSVIYVFYKNHGLAGTAADSITINRQRSKTHGGQFRAANAPDVAENGKNVGTAVNIDQ
jgi:hypothetical protein